MKNSRLDGGVVKHLTNHADANVAEADVADKAFSDKRLHCFPGLLESHSVVHNHSWGASVDSGIVVDPLGWVLSFERHEWLSDWEVNQIQVQVVNT